MIEHVYKRARLADFLDGVYVATPNVEIKERVESFGGEVIMTSDEHRRASERVAEAARLLGNDADIVVNLQGDEPLINPEMIKIAVTPFLEDDRIQCVNLVKRVDYDSAKDIHEVKVVCDKDSNALYFSREPIASKFLKENDDNYLIEVCIMPFTKESLQLYTELPMYPLEEKESIDMLRWLENGYKVKIVESPFETYSVDIPSDIEKVERVMEKDHLISRY
jgi:3-deoxy-manno-octulosonate cytidylyltransferase (CMP-KDO synthetase)